MNIEPFTIILILAYGFGGLAWIAKDNNLGGDTSLPWHTANIIFTIVSLFAFLALSYGAGVNALTMILGVLGTVIFVFTAFGTISIDYYEGTSMSEIVGSAIVGMTGTWIGLYFIGVGLDQRIQGLAVLTYIILALRLINWAVAVEKKIRIEKCFNSHH